MNTDRIETDILVLIDIKAKNAEAAIEKLATNLFKKGYVKESYIQAVKDREKVFPTGLPTKGVGVAIPHTDVKHVKKPAIIIGVLANPVPFRMMGFQEEEINVEILFMLAITEAHAQIGILQSLMNIFQKKEVLQNMLECNNPSDIVDIFSMEY